MSAKWHARALDPKVIDYTFTARNEKAQAQKSSCALVSNAPAQYNRNSCPLLGLPRPPRHLQGGRI
eukprot:2403646-Pyramimonas_sp.AAC.1